MSFFPERIANHNLSRRNLGKLLLAAGAASTAITLSGRTIASAAEGPQPTAHTQKAYDPVNSDFHARWTRADARQIMTTQNDTTVAAGENSMPRSVTMPEVPKDFQPMNGSGLVLGSPTDLNLPADRPEAPQPGQNPRQFQAYSHYIQPDGLVQSFIDNVDGRRGGTLSPTVKINYSGATSEVDYSFGDNGLGPYAYLPTNKQKTGVTYVK